MPAPRAEEIAEAFRLLGIESEEKRERVLDKLKKHSPPAREEEQTYILASQEWETSR
jgi:signal recognition particle subunit SEC65